MWTKENEASEHAKDSAAGPATAIQTPVFVGRRMAFYIVRAFSKYFLNFERQLCHYQLMKLVADNHSQLKAQGIC